MLIQIEFNCVSEYGNEISILRNKILIFRACAKRKSNYEDPVHN